MPSYAYFHKRFVPLTEAKIGVMTHALHYGTAVFEGIRGNWNSQHQQIYIFRLKEHYQRLKDGSHLLRMNLPHSIDKLCRITVELVQKCGFKEDIYIRPLVYKSSEALGVRLHDLDNDFLVFAIPWGRYLDMEACRCRISSWRRPADNVIPPRAKITGLYVNNAFTKTEAMDRGFDEGIMLSPQGHVSEGSGENIFLVKNGKLMTPPVNDSILIGITRDTAIMLAKNELGMETIEKPIEPEELFTADECFLTGTAAHITPVVEIDNRKIGNGRVGEVASKLQKLYFEVIKGNNQKYLNWCTPAYKK
ncbi:MAG: branched-chain amino acid transaminase [Dehalococcoidia bacterium]|nr:MAG: branched-chain amino acid transaminase [Dehalococcoidia bacterium]